MPSSYDQLREAAKNLALTKYRDYSNEQLDEIVKRNVQLLPSLLYSSNESQFLEGIKLSGEMDGCVEILNYRKAMAEQVAKSAETWKRSLTERRKDAILNLPIASSANGQLVVSILEETECFRGATGEELRAWYDEFLMMDDKEWDELLEGLVKEGVISFDKDSNKYYLFRVCDETLFSVFDAGTLIRYKSMFSSNDAALVAVIMLHLKSSSLPLSDDELAQQINNRFGLQVNKYKVRSICTKLQDIGLVSRKEIDNKNYIKMLGEKR